MVPKETEVALAKIVDPASKEIKVFTFYYSHLTDD